MRLFWGNCLTLIAIIVLASCSSYKVKIPVSKEEPLDSSNTILNVYIENSGSMDGYVFEGSDFKSDMYSYVSAIQPLMKKTNYFYINSNIIPIKDSSDQFFNDLSAQSFKEGGGNRASSELVDMMQKMLANANDRTISIFTSDCILDPGTADAMKMFKMRMVKMRALISDYLSKHEDFGIKIYCLKSSFNGNLFPPGGKPISFNGTRPYYIWVFGSNKLMGMISKKISASSLLSNIEHTVSFVNCENVPYTITKEFATGVNANGVMEIKGSKEFQIKIDFSQTLQDDAFLTNIKNYKQTSPVAVINKITKISSKNDKYTHLLDVSFKTSGSEQLYLELNKYPKWADDINDDKGTDKKRTCGIKYIINGISDAYANAPSLKINFDITE